jgi:hypothetical protein
MTDYNRTKPAASEITFPQVIRCRSGRDAYLSFSRKGTARTWFPTSEGWQSLPVVTTISQYGKSVCVLRFWPQQMKPSLGEGGGFILPASVAKRPQGEG